MSDTETIVLRPAVAPAGPVERSVPLPETALRDAVLAGSFFGKGRSGEAERLADFLHATRTDGERLADWFGDALPSVLRRGPNALRLALDRDIAAIDTLMCEQLDAVLHAPRVQALEGRWRGLHWLVDGIEPSRRVKVRVLPITWPEIARDLDRAAEFDQSNLFRRIYEDEFGMPGGEPYGLLVIDHEVRHRRTADSPTDDVGVLSQLSAVGAAAFAPIVVAAHPSLLEVDRFGDLGSVQDIAAPFRNTEHARWRTLATRPDTRFIAVTLPRLLARLPWRDDPGRTDGFRYREHAPDDASRVWMSAGYAFAACVTRAFATHGWPADVRGVETDRVGGGLVQDIQPETVRERTPTHGHESASNIASPTGKSARWSTWA